MAAGTSYIRVNAFQFEKCAGVVVEQRWLPLVRIVATGATDDLAFLLELGGMRVGVASFAIVRRQAEVDVSHPDFQVRRLMALDASNGSVRSK